MELNDSEAVTERVIDALDATVARDFAGIGKGGRRDQSDEEEDGPQPLPQAEDTGLVDKNVSYGGALLPGEGAAIAQYVQKNIKGHRTSRRTGQGQSTMRNNGRK